MTITFNGNNYEVLNEQPVEGDLVLLPDNTVGKLSGVRSNGKAFTDGLNGATFTSFLNISKYRKVKRID